MKLISHLIFFVCINIIKCETEFCVIEVGENDIIKGVISLTPNQISFCSYLGIPYAEPPIGNLRFEPPLKIINWKSKIFLTELSNKCLQFDDWTGDEDCLYLNVYTTQILGETAKENLRPVFFWIHGGSFNFGSASSDVNGTDYIVEKDVVVVTINYRLSVLGFLSIPEVNISGNFGLKDQQMAMKWVQENILKFGGDANRVTIVGWSAGAASVTYHMYEKSSNGLFHNAIAMSGTMLSPWAFLNDQKMCTNKFLLELYQVEDMNITNFHDFKMKLQSIDLSEFRNNVFYYFGYIHSCFIPTIENTNINKKQFIIETPQELIKQIPLNDVPLLIGLTNLEIETLGGYNPYFYTSRYIFKNQNETIYNLIQLFIEKLDTEKENKFRNIADIVYPTLNFIRAYDNMASSDVFMYKFSYDGKFGNFKENNINNRKGAVHGDDLGYLFKSFCCDSSGNISSLKNETFIRKIVVEMWTNFIKFGNPTPKQYQTQINWPNYKDNKEYINIDLNIKILKDENNFYYNTWNIIEKCLQNYECNFLNQ